jgi:hypothetical protein
MPRAGNKIAQVNFSTLLERLTDKKRWMEVGRPDSGTGFDHWFASGTSEANINRDQERLTVTVDGETFFEGTVEEAAKI